MRAPPLRNTESVISSATWRATSGSMARPMRTSANMWRTAPVAALQMAAAR